MIPWGWGRLGAGVGVGLVTSVLTATTPKTLVLTAFLPLYTTYCRRMLDIDGLSQEFMPCASLPYTPVLTALRHFLYNILQMDVLHFRHKTHASVDALHV